MLNRFRESLHTFVVKHTGLGKSIAKIFVELVFGMVELGSVKHKKLAQTLYGNVVTSNTRTIERFFSNYFISSQCLGLMIYDLLKLKYHGTLTIILDRTNWEFGSKDINIFVATIVLGNTSIPIALEVFDNNGATSFTSQKALLEQVIALIGFQNIKVVLADREFIGNKWFKFLYQNKIPFVIRIRNNCFVEFRGTKIKVCNLMKTVTQKEQRNLNVKLGDLALRLAAARTEAGELVIVIAPRYFRGKLLKQYRVRWLIELYFRSIKSKGFNLEETHMTNPDRIKELMIIIAIASAIVIMAGEFRRQIKKIPIKKHGCPAYSTFTYGLDLFRAILRNKIITPMSISTSPNIFRPWSEFVNLLFSFILGTKYVGY